MKYLKTYELFDFLWNKPIANEEEWKAIIDECFYELEDLGFDVYPLHKTIKSGEVKITKPGVGDNKEKFMISEVLPTIETALSYLGDEYGFKLDEIEFRETKWTHKKSFWGGTSSGTKKLHRYGKLKYIKGDYETWYVKLELKRSQSYYPGKMT